MPFNQLEKSAIVRLYEKYSVDFRMFGYDSQVLVIANHLLAPSGALIAVPTNYWSSTTNHFFRFSRSAII